MTTPVFRFAPTPNGLLHLGHAYSALLNQQMAREVSGRLLLRIEDSDTTRCRPEYTRALFEDLAWLGLAWESPVRVQSEHFCDYEKNLARLWSMGAIYPCFCSRKQAAAAAWQGHDPDGQPRYAGTCRQRSRQEACDLIEAGAIPAWRIDMEAAGDCAASVWGDAVIARPKVGSWYHIAVVTDDSIQGVTHVVRGKDIEPATSLHMLLQRLLALPTPSYFHHELIRDEHGTKLSKSLRSTALRHLREQGATPASIRSKLGFD